MKCSSKTYDDVSKKHIRQVLPALHTWGENDESLAVSGQSGVDHLRHDNLALGIFEHLKSRKGH